MNYFKMEISNTEKVKKTDPIGNSDLYKDVVSKDFDDDLYPDFIGHSMHYPSPASTVAHTDSEHEGDADMYTKFRPVTPPYAPAPTAYKTESTTSSIPCDENELERTVAIIKPEAMKYRDVVVRAVNQAGFQITNQRIVHLTPEQVSEIYEKYYGDPTFPYMVVTMSVSPVYVLSLAAVNAIDKWKTLVGPYGTLREEWFYPYSVRVRFGICPDMSQVLHASENTNEAKSENRFFFSKDILEPITDDYAQVNDYISFMIKPTLLEGLAELVKCKPIDPIIFLAEWLLLHNPNQPKLPELIALTPT